LEILCLANDTSPATSKEPAYNPFPKTGLVKQFEPRIRNAVNKFCKNYPQLRRQDVLFRAVELAIAAERTFKPELGFSFATHADYRLKELHRLHEKQEHDNPHTKRVVPCKFKQRF
jgi:hypothetical protein